MKRIITVLTLCCLATLFTSIPGHAQTDERCFDITGYCISGSIRAYWEANGGLPVFGYPTSSQQPWTVEGRSLEVQWFERDRLEIQPEGYVTAGRLGARLLELRGTPWETFPKAESPLEQCVYFAETGHNLCPPFSGYWEANGGLERFGYPITEPFTEAVEGQPLTVQYFERRRMEWHPEIPGVLLGLLGNEVQNAPPPVACAYYVAPGLGLHLAEGSTPRFYLGCPAPDYIITEGQSNAAEQYFERGVMLYIRPPGAATGYIYVITTTPLPVSWQRFADTWTEGEPESGGETPPDNLIEPKRGFGKVWREQPGVREAVGWAISAERPTQALVQRFQNGEVVWLLDTDYVYTMYGELYNRRLVAATSRSLFYNNAGRIVFTAGTLDSREIYMINPDGNFKVNLSRHPADDYAPTWSPDNMRMAFVSERDANAEIYLVDPNVGIPTNLTKHPGLDRSPDWSPDGNWIAFESDRSGNTDIFVMQPDSANAVNLTNNSAADAFPAWSPDSSRIAFVSDRAGGPAIFVMNTDGSAVTRLSQTAIPTSAPVWSPDGNRVAFVATGTNGVTDIFLVNADGSGLTNVTDSAAREFDPDWSPDGNRIVFARQLDGPPDIFFSNTDGSGLTSVAASPAFDGSPVWSADNVQIAFVSNRSGSADIHTVYIDGLNLARLTRFIDAVDLIWLR